MIEKATVDDVAEIVNIIAEYRGEGQPSDDLAALRASAAHQLHACLKDSSNCSVIVARNTDSQAQGYLIVHWIPFPGLPGLEGYISDLFVASKDRGQGLGKELLLAVEDEAGEKGACRLMLNNRKSAESYSRQFYAKADYSERTGFANFVKALALEG
jgi:GNAT superfamily N-acetyltransferase